MPMLTTLRMRLPVWPFHAPLADAVGEGGHLVEHGVDLGHDVLAVDDDRRVPCGARSATCSTARFSVTLIFSPRNMASMRARRPDSSASCDEQPQRLVGDAVLRVVEVEAGGLDRQALAALRVVRRRAGADATFDRLAVVRGQCLPG